MAENMRMEIQNPDFDRLFQELSALMEQSRTKVVVVADSVLTILFWNVGKRTVDEILNKERAEYGKQVVPSGSTQLEVQYGRNFTEKNVRRMVHFATEFPDSINFAACGGKIHLVTFCRTICSLTV